MGQFLEYLKISIKSILDNKMRSILTMFGIIIGIGSVIMIVSVGNGVKGSISGQLDSAFGGQTYITAGKIQGMAITEVYPEAAITPEEIDAIRESFPHIKTLSMEEAGYGKAYSLKGEKTAYYYAVNETYESQKPQGYVAGRYFTDEEYESASPVCVLNYNSARNLFGHTDVVGQTFTFELDGVSRELRVVGVRDRSDSELYNLTYMEDEVEFEMPYTLYRQISGDDDASFLQVLFMSDSVKDAEDTVRKIIVYLEAKKNLRGQEKINYISFTSYLDSIMKIVNYITIFIAFVAAISLGVGGVGVMNIMLVSVTERTREIGIRKALGARTSSIIIQFLAEAALLTFLGGIFGLLFGYLGGELICFIISKVAGMEIVAQINALTVFLITAFSTAIGIFFGIYPARKAAKLSPIEALRQE